MFRLFSAALVAVFLLTIFQVASNPKTAIKCGPYASRYVAAIHAMVMASHPNSEFRDLKGEEKKSFVEGFNASPPASSIPFDLVRIYTRPDALNPLILIGVKGCVLKATVVPTWIFELWLKGQPVPNSLTV